MTQWQFEFGAILEPCLNLLMFFGFFSQFVDLSMIKFTTTINRFDKQGEKTGWTYIEISASQAKKINQEVKVGYRVKGKLDNFSFEKTALLPMGEGRFIMPLKAAIRKFIGKRQGDKGRC